MHIDSKSVSGKFAELLRIAAKQLSTWLKKNLSSLDEGWWNSLVLPALSYQQRQRVDRKNISELDGFDLAALLRIFDQNWYQFAQIFNFSTQDRHYVKEMQTIRNRWAHIDTQDFNAEDVYRDIDTLQRFLQILIADAGVLSQVKQFKNSVLCISPSPPLSEESEEIKSEETGFQNTKMSDDDINVGSIVALNSDPTMQGAVVEIEGQTPDSRCKIFLDGKLQPFYMSQIHLVIHEETKNVVSLRELHSLLTCLQIRHPSLSTLYLRNVMT